MREWEGMNSRTRHDLSDAQWASVAPYLPPQRASTGRPAHDHRRILNGIVWILATGAPWRDLPARYGNWQTVYSRFRRWQRAGIWERVFTAVKQAADARGDLDWSVQYVDGTTIRAHQHAAGARRETTTGEKRGTRSRRSGRRWDAVAAAGAASCTCALSAAGGRSPSV
jgi:transposase